MCGCEVVEWEEAVGCVEIAGAEFVGDVCGCRADCVYCLVELFAEDDAVVGGEEEDRDGEDWVVEGDCVERVGWGDGFQIQVCAAGWYDY